MQSQICYFPEATNNTTTATVLPLQRKAKQAGNTIHYFPELEEAAPEGVEAYSGVSTQILQQVEEVLILDEAYKMAITKLGALAAEGKEQQALIKQIVTATVAATITKIQADPAALQLEQSKASGLPGYLKQLGAPLIEPAPTPIETTFAKERQLRFNKIGQLLKRTREKRGFSHSKLNHLTHILTAHIAAIEAGDFERLPEDVYIKGFIRRLGDALGLNGQAIAATFPMPQPEDSRKIAAQQADNSWQAEAGRYVGYTALMMGAVSGLSWSLNQAQSNNQPMQPLTPTPIPANQATDETAPQIVQTDAKISPPEMMQVP